MVTILISFVCLSIGNSSVKISDFVEKGIQTCKENPGSCHNNQFFDTDVTQISPSWFAFATSTPLREEKEAEESSEDTCEAPASPVPGWQGAMHYMEPITAEEIYEGEFHEGLYIYPDWASCIEGVWEYHMLIEGKRNKNFSFLHRYLIHVSRHLSGYQCKIEEIDFENGEIKITKTNRLRDSPLSYNPPNFYSFGLPANFTDPFEKNTVMAMPSTMEGAGQGLFMTRAVRAGELISFYSGLILDCKEGHDRSKFDRRIEPVGEREKRNTNTLSFMDVTKPEKKFDICVFVPREYSSLDQFSVTMGHKANHDVEPNAR